MPPRTTLLLLPLLASTTCAQITTSYLLPNGSYGTNRIRFLASIIDASSDIVTLEANVAPDPDFSALGGWVPATYTLAPTLYEGSTSDLGRNSRTDDTPGASAWAVRCDIQPSAPTAACTISRGPSLAAAQCRLGRPVPSRTQEMFTQLWTFSEEGERGTETIVHTIPGSPTTPEPEWCGTTATAASEVDVPSSARVNFVDEPRSHFGLFQFVITAGEEKLPGATAGGSVGNGSASASQTETPTGTGALTESSGEAPKGTESAPSKVPGSAPMVTVAPVMAGVGAALAMFL